jgi:glycosyltransferase involved in cell wall biosynthesis
MPIVLKKRTEKSPGIIVFTHNEILRGITKKSKKIDNILIQQNRQKKWIFGIHIQGDCSNLNSWPYKEWHNFFMWPEKREKFLKNIPPEKITELTCVNFLNEEVKKFNNSIKKVEIISVTRFSSVKNIQLTLEIFKKLSNKNENYKFILIAQKEKPKKNFFQNKELDYFKKTEKIIENIKNNSKYRNIEFIINETNEKGLFPLTEEEVYKKIAESKYLILNSYREGVPRVLIEAICLNTKIIISNKLRFGLLKYLNINNSFIYDEKNKNINEIIDDIQKELMKANNTKVKNDKFKEFDENYNKIKLFDFLKKIFISKNIELEDINHQSWKVENLKYRLACHFKKANHQILYSENLFIDWFDKANNDKFYEDINYSDLFTKDSYNIFLELRYFCKKLIRYILRKIN